MARGAIGSRGLRFGQRGLGAREAARGAVLRFARLRRVVRSRLLLGERGVLGGEPVHDARRIGDQRFLALEVAGELRDAAVKLSLALLGALFFGVERLAGERDAMQGRAAPRLLLAQRRQGGSGDRLRPRGLALRAGALRHLDKAGVEALPRVGERRLVLAPGDELRQRLVAADSAGQLAIAVRLARLTLEAVDLGVDLLQDVLEAGEIVLGALEPELGLVPARVEARDARGLLQDQPARLGLGGNDLADLALAHQRGRARSRRSVGEQKLHVARTHLLAVDAVGRTLVALDAPRDLDALGIVEGRGRAAVGIVEHEPDLGVVARGRRPEPAKMTSSMPEPRMFLNELSPITQRKASTGFDLPQPFGPTTPVGPARSGIRRCRKSS